MTRETQETSLWLKVFVEYVLLNIAVDWLQDKNDHKYYMHEHSLMLIPSIQELYHDSAACMNI